MPNWLVHLAVAWIIVEIFNLKKYRGVFLLGSVLPDAKTFAMALTPLAGITKAYALAIPVHTPIGTSLLAAFTAALFNEKFKKIFILLLLGSATHFALDITMYPYYGAGHYLLLYPFSWTQFGIPLYYLTEYLTPIVVIFAIAATLMRIKFNNNKINN
jgi:hypothetical protein